MRGFGPSLETQNRSLHFLDLARQRSPTLMQQEKHAVIDSSMPADKDPKIESAATNPDG